MLWAKWIWSSHLKAYALDGEWCHVRIWLLHKAVFICILRATDHKRQQQMQIAMDQTKIDSRIHNIQLFIKRKAKYAKQSRFCSTFCYCATMMAAVMTYVSVFGHKLTFQPYHMHWTINKPNVYKHTLMGVCVCVCMSRCRHRKIAIIIITNRWTALPRECDF